MFKAELKQLEDNLHKRLLSNRFYLDKELRSINRKYKNKICGRRCSFSFNAATIAIKNFSDAIRQLGGYKVTNV